jgi:hypothetical protein
LQPATPSSGPILSVEFPGGTVKGFVEAVRQAARADRVNVIVPKEAESVQIPAISLRDVTAYTALQSLEYAVIGDSGYQFKVARIGKTDESSATFAIQFYSRGMQQASSSAARLETRVISIHDLISPPPGLPNDPAMVTSPETLLNALKAASQLDVDSSVPPPEIMFHKESELLIIRGTPEQLQTMQSVVGQLASSLDSRRTAGAAAADRERQSRLQKAELRAQIDLNHSQAAMAAAQLDQATADFNRLKQLVDAGQASVADLDNAKTHLAQARGMLEQAATAERNLKEKQAILEARAQAGGGPDGTGSPGSEMPVLVIYDYRDLQAFSEDLWAIIKAVIKLGGGTLDVNRDVQGPGTLALRATPAEHAVIVKALNAMRRAKANEPKLPGLDAEDLIRKSQDK